MYLPQVFDFAQKYVKRQFKLTSPKRVHKHFPEIPDDGQDVFS